MRMTRATSAIWAMALSLAVFGGPDGATAAKPVNRLFLNSGVIDTAAPTAAALRSAPAAFAGNRLHLVQFAGPVTPDQYESLVKSGVRIVSYIPQNAYLVYGDSGTVGTVRAMAAQAGSGVGWDGPFLAEYRIHPKALQAVKSAPNRLTKLASDKELLPLFSVQMVLDPVANALTLAVVDRLKLDKVVRDRTALGYRTVVVALDTAALSEVANQQDVVSIQPFHIPKLSCERQAQVMAGNISGNGPSGPGYLSWLTGRGFTQAQFDSSAFAVDVSDSGLDNGTVNPNHPGLRKGGTAGGTTRIVYSRLEGTPNTNSTVQGCDGHGTLNTHIIAGFNNQAAAFPPYRRFGVPLWPRNRAVREGRLVGHFRPRVDLSSLRGSRGASLS